MPEKRKKELARRIEEALAEADQLGLVDVGIGLDRARVALVQTPSIDLALLTGEMAGNA